MTSPSCRYQCNRFDEKDTKAARDAQAVSHSCCSILVYDSLPSPSLSIGEPVVVCLLLLCGHILCVLSHVSSL